MINMDSRRVQLIYSTETRKRKLFNGRALVTVQSTGEPGEIILTAKSGQLKQGELKIIAFK